VPDADADRHGSAMREDAWKARRRGTWFELLDVMLLRIASEPLKWRSTMDQLGVDAEART
jgi:hypothetical protein